MTETTTIDGKDTKSKEISYSHIIDIDTSDPFCKVVISPDKKFVRIMSDNKISINTNDPNGVNINSDFIPVFNTTVTFNNSRYFVIPIYNYSKYNGRRIYDSDASEYTIKIHFSIFNSHCITESLESLYESGTEFTDVRDLKIDRLHLNGIKNIDDHVIDTFMKFYDVKMLKDDFYTIYKYLLDVFKDANRLSGLKSDTIIRYESALNNNATHVENFKEICEDIIKVVDPRWKWEIKQESDYFNNFLLCVSSILLLWVFKNMVHTDFTKFAKLDNIWGCYRMFNLALAYKNTQFGNFVDNYIL